MSLDGHQACWGGPASGLDAFTDPEIRLLWMLDAADTTIVFNGRVMWSLDADDLCELIRIALELPKVLPGGPEGIRDRVARLLGATAPPRTRNEIHVCRSDGAPAGGVEPCR